MASVMTSPLRCRDREVTVLCGKITLAAGDSVVSSSDFFGATVASTATGVFLITLEGKYAKLLGVSIMQGGAAANTDVYIKITDNDVATAGTLEFTTVDVDASGSAAHPAAGSIFYITLHLKNSSSR